MILAGQLTDHVGGCRYVEAVAETDPYLRRSRTFNVRTRHTLAADIHSILPDCPIVTGGHNGPRIGCVRHAERLDDGNVWIVGDVDNLNARGNEHGELFFSLGGEPSEHGDPYAGLLDVHEVVLTHNPAMLLRPVKVLGAGHVADVDEAVWLRLRNRHAFTANMLQRARAEVRARRPGDPVGILDRREPEVTWLTRNLALIDGEPQPARTPGSWMGHDGAQHGPLWTRPGRILRVG